MKTLKETLCALTAESDSGAKDGRWDEAVRTESVLMKLKESVNDIIVFCHRSCQGLDQKQREVGAVRGYACCEELTLLVIPCFPYLTGSLVSTVGHNDGVSETSKGAQC